MVDLIRVPQLEGVSVLVDGLGMSQARVGLLAALHARGGSATGPDLSADTGISTSMVSHHLRHLEHAGIVTTDRTRSRGGPALTWTVNYDVLRSEWDALARIILPPE